MGNTCSHNVTAMRAQNERKILLLGVEDDRKRAIVQNVRQSINSRRRKSELSMSEVIGFDVEPVSVLGKMLEVWDISGNSSQRPLWRHHYAGTQGIFFVVAGTPGMINFEQSQAELNILASDPSLQSNVPIVIFLDQNTSNNLSEDSILAWELSIAMEDHPYMVVVGNSESGDGIDQALEFLARKSPSL